MVIRIRPASLQDADEIGRLHVDSMRAAYRGIVPDENLARQRYEKKQQATRECISGDVYTLFVAEAEGRIAGFVAISNCRDEDLQGQNVGELCAIYLAPEFWRKGIGRRLAEYVEPIFLSRGQSDVVLWVLEENNDSRRFYEALGYALDGGRKIANMGKPLQTVRYRKTLTPGGKGA